MNFVEKNVDIGLSPVLEVQPWFFEKSKGKLLQLKLLRPHRQLVSRLCIFFTVLVQTAMGIWKPDQWRCLMKMPAPYVLGILMSNDN